MEQILIKCNVGEGERMVRLALGAAAAAAAVASHDRTKKPLLAGLGLFRNHHCRHAVLSGQSCPRYQQRAGGLSGISALSETNLVVLVAGTFKKYDRRRS